jgi:hypothetical protein
MNLTRDIACGEPVWGSLADAAKGEGYNDVQIDAMVIDLQALQARTKTTS